MRESAGEGDGDREIASFSQRGLFAGRHFVGSLFIVGRAVYILNVLDVLDFGHGYPGRRCLDGVLLRHPGHHGVHGVVVGKGGAGHARRRGAESSWDSRSDGGHGSRPGTHRWWASPYGGGGVSVNRVGLLGCVRCVRG